MAELGWCGVCVEPSPEVFEKLATLYMKNMDVYCYEVAIGNNDTFIKFYNNTNAVATTIEHETKRWTDEKFNEITVEQLSFNTLLDNCIYKQFEFISIDIEGKDWEALQQMNLKELGCKMICLEHNGRRGEQAKYIDYCKQFGLNKILLVNAENIILAV